MARKVRRVRSQRSSDEKQSSGSGSSEVADELREEYAYVIKDLRHILLLAAIMFLLLIAVNLII